MDKKTVEQISKLEAKMAELEDAVLLEEGIDLEATNKRIGQIVKKIAELKGEDVDEVIDCTDGNCSSKDDDRTASKEKKAVYAGKDFKGDEGGWYTKKEEKEIKEDEGSSDDREYSYPTPGSYNICISEVRVEELDRFGKVVKLVLELAQPDVQSVKYVDSFFIDSNEVSKKKLAKIWLATGAKLTAMNGKTIGQLKAVCFKGKVVHTPSKDGSKIYCNIYYNKLESNGF